jgi:alkanesulfonate monooxygenase SsuD/methylene tetrahydromethanopterin reductase-like flavin-dependent oxidoreductase (luciferase family)
MLPARDGGSAAIKCGVFLPNFGPFGDIATLVDLARLTEASGWDGFFIWDHILFDNESPQAVVDPWVTLAAVATATQRIRFGALMTPLARRRPWKLARETATVDNLSGGRLVFGAGLGFPPRAEFGLFGEETDDRLRAEKLDEGLAVLAGLWTGEEFEYSGAQYSVGPTRFLPAPVQKPRPPVWIAGWWPNKRPFRRAARWDGVFPELKGGATPTPEQLREIVEYVGGLRESAAPFDFVLNGYTGADGEESVPTLERYADAGLTWWLERVDPTRLFSAEETRARIAAGPPGQ